MPSIHSVNITGLHIAMDGSILFASNVWTVSALHVDFGIQKLSVNFQGIEKMGDLLNELLSEIGPEMLDILWPDIEPIIVEMAKEVNFCYYYIKLYIKLPFRMLMIF